MKVEIWIMSRNRPEFVIDTIKSALQLDNLEIAKVVVSDNSTDESLRSVYTNFTDKIQVVYRRPNLSSSQHYASIFSESKSEYLTIFHDDDMLCPNYIKRCVEVLDRDESVVAVGCNAYIIKDRVQTEIRYMKGLNEDLIFTEPRSFVINYLSLNGMRNPPFPGYMYRRKLLVDPGLDYENGGKYSDVTFLLNLLAVGSIKIIGDPLMKYRFHLGNDSASESILDRISLRNFLVSKNILGSQDGLMIEYRLKYWIKYMFKNSRIRNNKWRRHVFVKFMLDNWRLLLSASWKRMWL